ncbi:multicopper oxidase family protein [Aquibacillus kalidii]|uniref:multicopper oxidase family protein n=1 Tax=Aquibacillus kalidii TaxID=2762597 RepID=UPI0016453DBA|nr:multicopper oxidase family protein [Aquibacillus kalidii]
MFSRCKENIQRKIYKINRLFNRGIAYAKLCILLLLYIFVFLVLIWVFNIINAVNISGNGNELLTNTSPSLEIPSIQSNQLLNEVYIPQSKKIESQSLINSTKETNPNKTNQNTVVESNPNLISPSQPIAESTEDGDFREFRITVYPETVKIDDELYLKGWTYNGTFPGPAIRVKEGRKVRIIFRNQVPGVRTTVHWHGIPTRNSVDGVPLLTQPYINYGEQYVYEFIAEPAGTYSYHSHGEALQLDMGMVGPFIIEPKDPVYPRTETEWVVSVDEMKIAGQGNPPPANDGNNMDQSMMQRMMPNAILGTADLYNVFTINGKRDPKHVFTAEVNQWVRMRIINFGFQNHRIKVEGMEMYVTHMDGYPLPKAQPVEYVEIAPYERVDVYLIGNKPGKYRMYDIDRGHSEFGLKAKVLLTESEATRTNQQQPQSLSLIRTNRGAPKYQGIIAGIPGPDETKYDRVYNMQLGMAMGNNGMSWAINKVIFTSYDKITPYKVKTGEMVKINLFNMSPENHPMHFHGHHFSIVSINGQTLSEPWISKDTINVKPMQQISIAFKADNPGDWIFHCHQVHHADSGLITYLTYVE